MTLYKFNKLSFPQQLLALEINGARLDFRKQDHYHVALFQMGSFYVEAYYPRESVHVEKLVAFTSTHKLKPYLERINVSLLLQ